MEISNRFGVNAKIIIMFSIAFFLFQIAIGVLLYELEVNLKSSEILFSKKVFWIEKFGFYLSFTLIFYYFGKLIEYNKFLNGILIIFLTLIFSYVSSYLILGIFEPSLLVLDIVIFSASLATALFYFALLTLS